MLQAVRRVKLRNNPISAEGLAALAAMLEACPRIVEVDVGGNHCERNFSHVHYRSQGTDNPTLAPAPGTIAQVALQQNLKHNQACSACLNCRCFVLVSVALTVPVVEDMCCRTMHPVQLLKLWCLCVRTIQS